MESKTFRRVYSQLPPDFLDFHKCFLALWKQFKKAHSLPLYNYTKANSVFNGRLSLFVHSTVT